MTLVEKELAKKNFEQTQDDPELVENHEIEKTLVPINPADFEAYRSGATPIEQVSLDEYGEDFQLRVRCEYTPDGPVYTAAIKDKGVIREIEGQTVLDRLELEVPISESAYSFYSSQPHFPKLRQLRAQIAPGLTVDFVEGEDPQIELETSNNIERAALMSLVEGKVIDRTGDHTLNKNYIAHKHANFERRYNGEPLEVFAKKTAHEMIAQYVTGRNQVVVGLSGMSGSGKTTASQAMSDYIGKLFGEKFRPIVISTDDYHFGKAYLEKEYGAPYSDWDHHRTYNIAEMAADLARLAEGIPLIKRHFDFSSQEPVFDEEVPPSPFVIVEGLFAGSPDLADVRTLHRILPTGPATCVGRDLVRMGIEKSRAEGPFPTRKKRFAYLMEQVIPAFLSQEYPEKERFSESIRPMAERAFMLELLRSQQ
jgi:uridine kinase